MDEQTYNYVQTYQQPMESASGTTSPNNGKTGPAAYIITALCVAFLVGICMGLSNCVRQVMNEVMPEVIDELVDNLEGEVYYLHDDLDTRVEIDTDFDADSFEEYFEQVFGIPFSNVKDDDSDSRINNDYEFESLTVLNLDLAIYDHTIDDMVSASAYAGSDPEVKDFVRELVLKDREMAEDLIRQLRAAARDDGNTEGRLHAARDIAESAIMEITAIEMPDADDQVTSYLSEAVEEAVARWSAIDELIELIQENDTITDQALEAVDDNIYYGTRNAAQALENALAASAN